MTVRVALVGCGTAAARLHLPGYRAGGDAEVVAFASRTRASAERVRDDWGGGEVVDDWRIAVTRDDVDAVDVCVPNALHTEVALEALKAGKHVLVEKPMTTTLADADALIAASEAAGRRLMVAHEMRFAPVARTMQRLLRDGEIGGVRRIRAALGHPGPESWSADATWFRDATVAGGGALMDLGVHLMDAVAWLGDSAVAEIAGATLTGDDALDEQADVVLRLDSGVPVSVHASWQVAAGRETMVRVDGDTGSLHITAEAGLQLLRPGQQRAAITPDDTGLDSPSAAFARAVATDLPVPVDGAVGRAALAAVLAAYESARTRRAVRVDA